MPRWDTVRPGPSSAAENMARDRLLLETLETPILHLYEWEGPSATYGHFIKPGDYLNVGEGDLQLARRPTGGGILFHTCDLAFSVLAPASCPFVSQNTLENYAWVNRWVLGAIHRFVGEELALLPVDPEGLDAASGHFCMAKPTIYDIMVGERKVGGAAQRRTRRGLLHQGSICLTLPAEEHLSLLLPGTRVREAMGIHSYPLLSEPGKLEEARAELRQLLVEEAPVW